LAEQVPDRETPISTKYILTHKFQKVNLFLRFSSAESQKRILLIFLEISQIFY